MKHTLFASCLVLLLLTQAAFAQSDKAKAKKIDELIGPFAASNQFSGVVLASEDGKVIYEKAFGLANADYKIPNQLNTRIGIASITKLMTAVIGDLQTQRWIGDKCCAEEWVLVFIRYQPLPHEAGLLF